MFKKDRPKDPKKVAAGQAAHRKLTAGMSKDAYCAFQQRCREGEAVTKRAIRNAHLARRSRRLARPTPGEAAIRALLTRLGFTIHLDPEPFDYCTWSHAPSQRPLDWRAALAEGGVGPYFCDVLLPVLAVTIEVEGGIHVLSRERDARRRAFLEAQELTVIVVPDTDEHPLDLAAVAAQLTPYLRKLPIAQAPPRAA